MSEYVSHIYVQILTEISRLSITKSRRNTCAMSELRLSDISFCSALRHYKHLFFVIIYFIIIFQQKQKNNVQTDPPFVNSLLSLSCSC